MDASRFSRGGRWPRRFSDRCVLRLEAFSTPRLRSYSTGMTAAPRFRGRDGSRPDILLATKRFRWATSASSRSATMHVALRERGKTFLLVSPRSPTSWNPANARSGSPRARREGRTVRKSARRTTSGRRPARDSGRLTEVAVHVDDENRRCRREAGDDRRRPRRRAAAMGPVVRARPAGGS